MATNQNPGGTKPYAFGQQGKQAAGGQSMIGGLPIGRKDVGKAAGTAANGPSGQTTKIKGGGGYVGTKGSR